MTGTKRRQTGVGNEGFQDRNWEKRGEEPLV